MLSEPVFNRRRLLIAGVGVLAAGVVPTAFAAEDDVKAYLGAFRYTGGETERRARDKAIDDVVSGMSFLVRKIARDRLVSANPIASELSFAASAKSLTITMDKRSYTGPLDGTKTRVKSITGDDMDMRYDFGKKSLAQIFEGEGKGRVNVFTLDGKKHLQLQVRVHAKQLPKDLVYRLSYERA